MPLYDYECKACEHQFDELIPMADREKPTRRKCPECGKKKVKQILLGTPSIGDSVRLGITKTDDGFKEVSSRISDNNPRSNLHKKLSRGRRKVGFD